jgi:hypothetical protein
MEFNGVVREITEGRMSLYFWLKNNPYEPVYFYAEEEYLINIGDSISKKKNSDKLEVYVLENGVVKYRYYLFMGKNQFIYDNLVKID